MKTELPSLSSISKDCSSRRDGGAAVRSLPLHVHAHTHAHTDTHRTHTYTHTRTRTHTYTHAHVHAHTHTRSHVHTHAHRHRHTRTHTRTHTHSKSRTHTCRTWEQGTCRCGRNLARVAYVCTCACLSACVRVRVCMRVQRSDLQEDMSVPTKAPAARAGTCPGPRRRAGAAPQLGPHA